MDFTEPQKFNLVLNLVPTGVEPDPRWHGLGRR
jgi:hypothetical protein